MERRGHQRAEWQQINGIHGCFFSSELLSTSLRDSLAGELQWWSSEPDLGDPGFIDKLLSLVTRRRNDITRALVLGLFTWFSMLASARRTFSGTRTLPGFSWAPVDAISSFSLLLPPSWPTMMFSGCFSSTLHVLSAAAISFAVCVLCSTSFALNRALVSLASVSSVCLFSSKFSMLCTSPNSFVSLACVCSST
jgi:hypothetical protein|uniref:Uncharacterized protein n=1 Tax=Zea mays TaxID=4577 RepID=A0A804MPK9_MAIZE